MTVTDLLYYAAESEAPTDTAFTVAPAERGRVAYAPVVVDPEAEAAECVAVLVRADVTGELVAVNELERAWGHTAQAQLHDTGDGSVTLDNTDPDLADIADGDMVQFRLRGQAVFTARVGDDGRTSIAEGEEHDHVTTLKGPGLISVLSTAEVYPSRGPGALPPEEDRTFNWSSVPFDDSAWRAASELTLVSVAQSGDWPFQPFGDGFPAEAGAGMIWAPGTTTLTAPGGDCYFRRTFTTASDVLRIFLYVLIDNYGEIYFDGQLVLTVDPTAGFTEVTTLALEVSPGEHLIAVHAVNFTGDGNNPAVNPPGGLGIAVYAAGPNNQPLSAYPLLVTDTSWKIVPYPPGPPGMTAGAVMRVAVEEAQARGALPGVTLGFTDTVDSEGTPWTEETDIATKVGNDVHTFFREMAETYTDIEMEPARLRLLAYVHDGLGSDTSIELQPPTDPADPTSGDLVNLTHRKVGQNPVNALLVKWHGGWAEAVNAPSVTAHGRQEAQLALGAAQSADEALRVASAQLDFYAHPREQASADIEPHGDTAKTPFLAFRPGDTVHIPDRTVTIDPATGLWAATLVPQRCVRLAFAQDDNGQVTFSGDFGDELLTPAERWERGQKKMTDGTLRGTSVVAAPASSVQFDRGAAKPDCCPPVPPPVTVCS